MRAHSSHSTWSLFARWSRHVNVNRLRRRFSTSRVSYIYILYIYVIRVSCRLLLPSPRSPHPQSCVTFSIACLWYLLSWRDKVAIIIPSLGILWQMFHIIGFTQYLTYMALFITKQILIEMYHHNVIKYGYLLLSFNEN